MTDYAVPSLSHQDRARGCLLGLAVGDALGTTLEFGPRRRPGGYHTEITGGGPFSLPAGCWTDDTSMALALAHAVIEGDGFLSRNAILQEFSKWYREGKYSPTGRCFDIGNQTRAAIEQYERTGQTVNNTEEASQGNGGIMRLAPIAIAASLHHDAVKMADRQSVTTHGSPVCIQYSRELAVLLRRLLDGDSIPGGELRDRLLARPRSQVKSGGHVVECYEAALWSVLSTTDFRGAVIEAANLGGDADTTAAVAGQIAGALYGASGIPAEWLDVLAWRDEITATADRLHKFCLDGRA